MMMMADIYFGKLQYSVGPGQQVVGPPLVSHSTSYRIAFLWAYAVYVRGSRAPSCPLA